MGKTKIGAKLALYPLPAVLVGTKVEDKPNFMTVAWCGIAGNEPPRISMVLGRRHYTCKGIEESKSFSINIASAGMAKEVDFCGLYSGGSVDKAEMFTVFYGSLESAPLIEECPVNIECRVIEMTDNGGSYFIVGEVIEVHVDDACMTEGKPDAQKIDPLIFATISRKYYRLGDYIGDAYSIGKKELPPL